jgi:hypothetical protein
MANTPFALSLEKGDLTFVHEQKKVWRGMTDADGRTPVFALTSPVPAEAIFLRPRIGDGPVGEQMRLTDPAGGPLAHTAYRLVLCTDPPQDYAGISDERGYTAYSASSEPRRIILQLVFATFGTSDEPAEPTADPKAQAVAENRLACSKAQ